MKRLVLLLLFVSPFVLPPGLHAKSIDPVVQFTSSSTMSASDPYTLGYSFTTTTAFTIDALGVWDDGQGNDRKVGIWDSNGNLLESTSVSGSAFEVDNFQWAAIDYELEPGSYVIGAEFLGGNFPSYASGITSLPGYTWGLDEQSMGSGLRNPTYSTYGWYGDNGILYADFSVGSIVESPTPEPSTFLLLGSGLAGLAGLIKRRLKA